MSYMFDPLQKSGFFIYQHIYNKKDMRFTLNESERNAIRDLYVTKGILTEQSDQSKKLYISWANKKSGNPEMAMSIMDDVLALQKSLPKKDFAKYSSYDELKKDLDMVISGKKETEAVKIYEDKDLLVIQANTWEASCKYGAGTKWCTAGKDTPVNWKRHNQTGTEFIWIFKNKPNTDPGYKWSHHIKINNTDDWCDALNNCRENLSDNSYPKQHPKYNEIIEMLKSINTERKLKDPRENQRKMDNLITTWIDEHFDKLMELFEQRLNMNNLWNRIWAETKNMDLYDLEIDREIDLDLYDFGEDADDDVYDIINNIIDSITNGEVPETPNLTEFDVDFRWDIEFEFQRIGYSSPEELEQIINTVDPNTIYNQITFNSAEEYVIEEMNNYAQDLLFNEVIKALRNSFWRKDPVPNAYLVADRVDLLLDPEKINELR